MSDDPLDRLAAEEDWRQRAKSVEAEVAKSQRKARLSRQFSRGPRLRSVGPAPVRRRGRISWLFLALIAVFLVTGTALWAGAGPVKFTVFLFVLSGWLITLCLHEFSHALTAHRGGDDTIVAKGYLRLDPRSYGHPLLTVVLPLIFLILGGLPLPGGAVQIETHRLRNRLRDALVSAAGPAVNIAAAIVLLAIVGIFGPWAIFSLAEPQAAFWSALTFLAYLQVATAILNLIPIPGLDGYGIIEPYLPSSTRYTGNKIKPFGVLGLFVLLMIPPVGQAFGEFCGLFVDLAGAPINGDFYGAILFRFWKL
ncbi:site-2 protease family protein [Rhizocola hellebori]|uniref:Site-2 protease family protein n=1 Tax=Rhizocola hellebori TaxID=1392758 RepID=A0A8J3QEP0_9ACTN|nr:site-2 protease family protein [Rhizocola hellebori]GIH08227.1 site-2 protease family protein [Rhizocola hellebori]